jgi:hypothetical protein
VSAGFTPAAFDNFRLYRKTQCVDRKRSFWARDIFGRAEVVEKTVGGLGREKGSRFRGRRLTCSKRRQKVPKTAAIVPEMSVVK